MTIHLDWLRAGRAPRGTPRRLFALGLIAGLALLQAGCQSGLSGNCGSCKSCDSCGFFRRTTARIFNRPSRSYDSTIVGDSAVEYSAPSTVVGPATTAGPLMSPQGGTTTVPSTVPLPSESTPLDLQPNEPPPTAKPGPSSPTTGAKAGSGGSRTSYFTRPSATKTAARLDSGPSTDRASMRRRPRSADVEPATETTPADDDNPLDHLPPLGLPGEVTQSATASPAPSASRPEGKAGDRPVGTSAARSSEAGDEEDISLLASETTAEPEAPAGAGTGIARFSPVDPKLAGGSSPSPAGLAWLAEKGYRTVLDLRPSREVSPTFIAEAAARGLRYVALPVDLAALDPDRLSRFQFELAAPEARPLFFFDADGSRAGALWYIRRVAVDRVDPQVARREAEEIGLKDQAAWQATTAYLDRLESAGDPHAPARTGAADPPTPPPAASAAADPANPARAEAVESHPAPGAAITSDAPIGLPGTMIPPLPASPRTASTAMPAGVPVPSLPFPERFNWKPFAAMILTGLSLPLAYWSRTAIPDAIARARASLPAPGPRPRSLPRASGE